MKADMSPVTDYKIRYPITIIYKKSVETVPLLAPRTEAPGRCPTKSKRATRDPTPICIHHPHSVTSRLRTQSAQPYL